MELKDRIATIIKVNQHNNSTFSEVIGVQRSSLSHILNGRNKPSLDFIEKVLQHFPRVDAGWLIMGKQSEAPKAEKLSTPKPTEKKIAKPSAVPKPIIPASENKSVDRIVIFYSDGTFDHYEQS